MIYKVVECVFFFHNYIRGAHEQQRESRKSCEFTCVNEVKIIRKGCDSLFFRFVKCFLFKTFQLNQIR